MVGPGLVDVTPVGPAVVVLCEAGGAGPRVWGSVAPPVVVADLVVRALAVGCSDGSLGGWLDTSAGAGASPLTAETGCEERPIL